jgi:hypothetical protein
VKKKQRAGRRDKVGEKMDEKQNMCARQKPKIRLLGEKKRITEENR